EAPVLPGALLPGREPRAAVVEERAPGRDLGQDGSHRRLTDPVPDRHPAGAGGRVAGARAYRTATGVPVRRTRVGGDGGTPVTRDRPPPGDRLRCNDRNACSRRPGRRARLVAPGSGRGV